MKIVYIVPGFGGAFYCQNCIRNLDLVEVLKKKKHVALLTPMYMPLRIDVPIQLEAPIFYGAINVYLREQFPIFNKMPSWIKKMLDSKPLLNMATKQSDSSNPKGLEEMTISVMKGEGGKHAKELAKLTAWLKDEIKPDIVHMSNSLLIGIAVKIKKELNIPVFCTLQDEDTWIDKMSAPYIEKTWEIMKEGSETIDAFISVSENYKERIHQKTHISLNKIEVVPVGIPVNNYIKQNPQTTNPCIGFLSRMSPLLGLDILVDAFIKIKEDSIFKNLKLKISGGMAKSDRKFVNQIRSKLRKTGFLNDVIIDPDLYKKDINEFFKGLTLLSVPVPKGEAFGTFLLESISSGIPVVQPDKGGYTEIVENTNGGITYEPNSKEMLLKTITELLSSPDEINKMSRLGYESVKEKYDINITTEMLLSVYKKYR